MKKINTSTVYKFNIYVITILFAIVSFIWMFVYNRYHIIGFQEEIQLFRTDSLYFQSYISKPGGLIDYIGSFFIQFYHYKWLGALIISVFISSLIPIFVKICNANNNRIDRMFILPVIISILLLIVCGNIYFHLTYILGIWLALICMMIYLLIPIGKKRYIAGFLLYFIVYFIAAGNALLYVSLVIISELYNKERSFIYMATLIVTAAAVPYLAHLFIYVALLEKTYLEFTPFFLNFPNKTYTIVWSIIPVIYLISGYIGKKNWLQNIKPLKVLIPSYIIIIAGLYYGIKSVHEPDLEFVSQMEYEAERCNWKKILEMRAQNPRLKNSDVLATFYTNIALSELGLLASQMFHFEQTGSIGLFLEWNPSHFTPWYTGDQYYRLGLAQEAEHSAYENMIASRKGYGAKALKRLANTTMLRMDEKGFEKYINLLEKSPIYKGWAKQQRIYYEKSKNDSTFQIPNTPKREKHRDFFINYATPEYNLIVMLRDNPQNKKAFENLVASILLQKQMNVFIATLDKYYAGMNYNKIPRHIEEALLICRYGGTKDMENILERYPVSKETIDEFMEYTKEAKNISTQMAIDRLEQQYGHTYWFYYLYINPILLNQQTGMKNRY